MTIIIMGSMPFSYCKKVAILKGLGDGLCKKRRNNKKTIARFVLLRDIYSLLAVILETLIYEACAPEVFFRKLLEKSYT